MITSRTSFRAAALQRARVAVRAAACRVVRARWRAVMREHTVRGARCAAGAV